MRRGAREREREREDHGNSGPVLLLRGEIHPAPPMAPPRVCRVSSRHASRLDARDRWPVKILYKYILASRGGKARKARTKDTQHHKILGSRTKRPVQMHARTPKHHSMRVPGTSSRYHAPCPMYHAAPCSKRSKISVRVLFMYARPLSELFVSSFFTVRYQSPFMSCEH